MSDSGGCMSYCKHGNLKGSCDKCEINVLKAENERLRHACEQTEHEVQQILGKALDYPWYKHDPVNFPQATEADGVCVGEHVAASLALEAAASNERLTLAAGADMQTIGRLHARIDAALALADTGSQEFKAAFPFADFHGAVPGWRVVEKVREVLLGVT